jgi:hypothetical protein
VNAVATIPQRAQAPLIPFEQLNDMAAAIARSGLFGMKNHDQALALMLVAQAEGQHPATVTQDYDIIQGRAARKTHSVLSRFQQMGGSVEWHELSETTADATFSHKAGGALRMTWTIDQAKKAGLTGKDNWKNYPRAMLRARCIAEGIRAVYPAALGGMLVSEEAQDLPPQEQQAKPAPARPERPASYSAEDFAANLPKWRELILSGRKSAADIVAIVSSKAPLTAEQQAEIFAIEHQNAEDAEVVGEEIPE